MAIFDLRGLRNDFRTMDWGKGGKRIEFRKAGKIFG